MSGIKAEVMPAADSIPTLSPAAPPSAGRAGAAMSVADAYAWCRRLAHSHYENFTVGSMLLPRALRPHIYALYAYCRTVDDLGDEAIPETAAGSPPSAADIAAYRLSLLDGWQGELASCYGSAPQHPALVALQHTIQAFDLPPEPLIKLIDANRMDQRINRYPTYADLLHYCDHSANPVGRLFLYLFGYRDAERQALSDATCTALQLTNFWQDGARDYQKGRIYIPQEDLDYFGYSESDLAAGRVNSAFRNLLTFEIERTRDLFRQGAALPDTLTGRVKLDVALFTRGGLAVLDAIQRQDYAVLTARPALSRRRKAALFLAAGLRWLGGRSLAMSPAAERSGG